MSGIDSPMVYEQLRDSILILLGTYASTRFRVVGYQKKSSDADEHLGLLRSVQIFFSEEDAGVFDIRERESEVVFQIEYTVAEPNKTDVATLDDPNSTPVQYAAALAGVQEGEDLANKSFDELRRMIIQILLDPANKDFGLDEYTVSSPRMRNFRKNGVLNRGSVFEVTGSERFSAKVTETFSGVTPTAAVQPAINAESEFVEASGDIEDNPSKISIDVDTT